MAFSRLRLSSDHYLCGIVVTAALVRVIIFVATSLPAILERRPELTSPLTSFRSLKEGVYLYDSQLAPYSGGVFYHSPIYLFLFTSFVPINSTVLTSLLWTAADCVSALLLVNIWSSRNQSKIPGSPNRDHIVALLYLFNPYALLSCLARSTTSLDNALILAAILGACKGDRAISMVFLALATHTTLYPVLLLLPLLLVLQDTAGKAITARTTDVVFYVAVLVAVAGLNTVVLGTEWVTATLGVILMATDLTPNVGMWWYFFTEMFDHFRPFFRGVFQLHLLVYVTPLCLRIADPLKAALVLVGAISTWKSYPTVGDMALWAGFLGCFPELVSNLKHPLFSLTTHLYTCILLPLLHSLWLLTGAGNANFFYAATMVYGLNATLAIADVLGAILSCDLKQRLVPLLSDTQSDDLTVVQLATLG